ncbi:hypothetical protein [Georgenia yuyongxinii]|uniref:Uncharacterized protein n=1 Tax=Georgenia yuyongxinii TaxID=2589797 RepID=A0A552WNX4_9MICO|nr:hypothetical protein [Georgenia yuyongxinii]TRW44394.1 hypothetical protein FJ693_13775 [Georgenia yuyongxinii]
MTGAENPTQRNRRRLEDAAARILAGNATVSDGKLTLKSLATEAGVPRNYLYRSEYVAIAEDFERRADALRQSEQTPDRREAQIQRLQADLGEATRLARRYREERENARAERNQAASQIVFLAEQNRLLREELEAERSVTRLDSASARNRALSPDSASR